MLLIVRVCRGCCPAGAAGVPGGAWRPGQQHSLVRHAAGQRQRAGGRGQVQHAAHRPRVTGEAAAHAAAAAAGATLQRVSDARIKQCHVD